MIKTYDEYGQLDKICPYIKISTSVTRPKVGSITCCYCRHMKTNINTNGQLVALTEFDCDYEDMDNEL